MFVAVVYLNCFSGEKKTSLVIKASSHARGVVRKAVIITVCQASPWVGFCDVVFRAVLTSPFFVRVISWDDV